MFEDVEVQRPQGKLYYYIRRSKGKIACTMMVTIAITTDAHTIAEIHNINTKPEFQRMGLAKELIDALKIGFGGTISHICTSWDDSTDAGRALMEKCGFVRHEKDKGVLFWKNENPSNVPMPNRETRRVNGIGSKIVPAGGGLILPNGLRHPVRTVRPADDDRASGPAREDAGHGGADGAPEEGLLGSY